MGVKKWRVLPYIFRRVLLEGQVRVVGNTATFCAYAPAGPWYALHHVRVRLPPWQPRSASRCTQPCHAGIAPAHAL
jgi:hypothetical protein